jgi:hypothetical protein
LSGDPRSGDFGGLGQEWAIKQIRDSGIFSGFPKLGGLGEEWAGKNNPGIGYFFGIP